MKDVELWHGDCLELMKNIPDGSVDLTVTSPPYDNLRTYNGNIEQWNFDKFKEIAKELYRVTANGGVVVWVVGDATVNGSETGTSFRQALWFMECGFNLHDTMIYEKAQACFGSNLCYLQSFEYMFVFSKGKPKTINFIRDRKNVRSGIESMSVSGLSKDGKKSDRHYKEMKEYGKRKNIWCYGVGGGKTGHPAVFPEQLANDHIISWSNESDTVLDCFMGSGTTGKMAVLNNRHFIGIELDDGYFNIAKKRIEEAWNRRADMAEYVTKEQIIDWYRPYGQTYEHIPFETLVSDLIDMKAADVATVRHGRWLCVDTDTEQFFLCNRCKKKEYWESDYCPHCGAKMDKPVGNSDRLEENRE